MAHGSGARISEFPFSQARFWDAFAVEYERSREPATACVAATLHQQLELQQATSVLEVGAGAGAGSLDIASRLVHGASLVATDFSPVMLGLARRKLSTRRTTARGPRVDVVAADAQRLPFADAAFDRYVSSLTLMLVENPADAIGEAARVLRPGGLAGWSVWGRPQHSPLRTLFFDAVRSLGIELPQSTGSRTPFHLGAQGLLAGLLKSAGFTRVITWYVPDVEWVRDGASFADDILRTESAARQLDARLVPAVRERLAQLADDHLDSGRPISLDVLIATARKP